MKKPWFLLGMVAAGLFLMNVLKKGAAAQTPEVPEGPEFGGMVPVQTLTISWEPGAGTDWYEEDGTARDYALRAIGFPYESIRTEGYNEVFEVDAPTAAMEGVGGMLLMMDGVRHAAYGV